MPGHPPCPCLSPSHQFRLWEVDACLTSKVPTGLNIFFMQPGHTTHEGVELHMQTIPIRFLLLPPFLGWPPSWLTRMHPIGALYLRARLLFVVSIPKPSAPADSELLHCPHKRAAVSCAHPPGHNIGSTTSASSPWRCRAGCPTSASARLAPAHARHQGRLAWSFDLDTPQPLCGGDLHASKQPIAAMTHAPCIRQLCWCTRISLKMWQTFSADGSARTRGDSK